MLFSFNVLECISFFIFNGMHHFFVFVRHGIVLILCPLHLLQELQRLSQKFDENVLDATKKFEKLITDKKEIEGLPATALGLAAQIAVSKVFHSSLMLKKLGVFDFLHGLCFVPIEALLFCNECFWCLIYIFIIYVS